MAVVVVLSLAIAAACSVFNSAQWILFPKESWIHDDKIRAIGIAYANSQQPEYFLPRIDFEAYRNRDDLFSSFAVAQSEAGNVTVDRKLAGPSYIRLWPGSLSTLGVTPAIGRDFILSDGESGDDHVAVVSHQFATLYFGEPSAALSRTIRIADAPCIIIGVLGPHQTLPLYFASDVYRPMRTRTRIPDVYSEVVTAIVRLKRDVDDTKTISALNAGNTTCRGDLQSKRKVTLSSLKTWNRIFRPEIHWALLLAVSFLYGIACLNAANLVVTRQNARIRERFIQRSSGATEAMLRAQHAIECAILAFAGTTVGGCLHGSILRAVSSVGTGFDGSPVQSNVIAASCALGLIAWLVLFAASRFATSPTRRFGGKGSSIKEAENLSTQSAAVVAQTALTVLLLAGSVSMMRTIDRLAAVDVGFDPNGLMSLQVIFPNANSAEQFRKADEISSLVRTLPGARNTAWSSESVLNGSRSPNGIFFDRLGNAHDARYIFISPSFLGLVGLTQLNGKNERSESPPGGAVITTGLAKIAFANSPPVGEYLKCDRPEPDIVVASVVGDIANNFQGESIPTAFIPTNTDTRSLRTLLVRYEPTMDAALLADKIRSALFRKDPTVIVSSVSVTAKLLDSRLFWERYVFSNLVTMAAVGLAISVFGLWAVVFYHVQRHMKEFGIRLALGSPPTQILLHVISRGGQLCIYGLLVGLGLAWQFYQLFQAWFIEATPITLFDGIVVGVIVCGCTLSACYFPARSAAKADVVRLLKEEDVIAR